MPKFSFAQEVILDVTPSYILIGKTRKCVNFLGSQISYNLLHFLMYTRARFGTLQLLEFIFKYQNFLVRSLIPDSLFFFAHVYLCDFAEMLKLKYYVSRFST